MGDVAMIDLLLNIGFLAYITAIGLWLGCIAWKEMK